MGHSPGILKTGKSQFLHHDETPARRTPHAQSDQGRADHRTYVLPHRSVAPTLVTIQGAIIRGSTIELPLKPAIFLKPFFNGIVTKIAEKFHPLASAVTGAKPALVLDLSNLPRQFSITVESIAFVPGAAIVTLGRSGVRYAR